MKIERSMHPQWLANTYLAYDESEGSAVMIDAGGPVGPLLELIDGKGLELDEILITHHHFDHVAELDAVKARHPRAEVLLHPLEAEHVHFDHRVIDTDDELALGQFDIRALHTPGHTAGMLSYLIDERYLFTGDTLFKGSIGGIRAPGHTTFDDIKRSIMEVLMKLPPQTEVLPGHADATTAAQEWESNPFIRLWRGLDREGGEKCKLAGKEATLILYADDYDGGYKAWVRWPDGSDDIVPGSIVEISN